MGSLLVSCSLPGRSFLCGTRLYSEEIPDLRIGKIWIGGQLGLFFTLFIINPVNVDQHDSMNGLLFSSAGRKPRELGDRMGTTTSLRLDEERAANMRRISWKRNS